ncbi:uncharacterized protein LOC116136112 [Pistacia vera]|uniref:uncharacterized protein LOC116136112 n=1 Tax=Pistacia vera TaxID=55513 RepID=UPI001262B36C|nr:uncharacterized protein LOC116136112 [Pistacia vera]
MTSQNLLADPDRLVSFGVLDEESRNARKLVTTANLRKYDFFSNKASLEPLEETMPPKESKQPRRAPFVFPRSRRERAAEAARPIPAQLVRTVAPSQPPVHEATRAEQVAQAPPARPRRKAPAQRSKKRKQALLAMRMSMEKTRLGAAKGSSDLQEEVAKLKKSLESAEAERTEAFDAANRYLSQKDAALQTVDFQKAELERRAEDVKELQRTTARLSKVVREKDQEIQATSVWAQRVEQEKEASEQEKRALEAELQESRERIASLTEELRNQSEELEEKAADWAIGSIYSLRLRNPDMDIFDLPEGWQATLLIMAEEDDQAAVAAQHPTRQGVLVRRIPPTSRNVMSRPHRNWV